MKTVALYRPLGQAELDLIENSGYASFPPRLADPPIFYPVLNREYAEETARNWNTPDKCFVGHVAEFEVDADYLAGCEVRKAGAAKHLEYWIRAEELENFNSRIRYKIRVVARFTGTK